MTLIYKFDQDRVKVNTVANISFRLKLISYGNTETHTADQLLYMATIQSVKIYKTLQELMMSVNQ